MTARWVVDVVAPERNLNITWQPISLLRKNEPDPDSEYYPHYLRTHKMLRVLESVRAADGGGSGSEGGGNAGFFKLYWELGTRIHNDGDRDFAMEDVLDACGLDASHIDAWEDEAWDETIAVRMDAGLDLVGADVGTPIIAIDAESGDTHSGDTHSGDTDSGNTGRLGIFGPVITKVPNLEDSLKLWDSVVTMTRIPGFWELKRTRTESPDFGDRPL